MSISRPRAYSVHHWTDYHQHQPAGAFPRSTASTSISRPVLSQDPQHRPASSASAGGCLPKIHSIDQHHEHQPAGLFQDPRHKRASSASAGRTFAQHKPASSAADQHHQSFLKIRNTNIISISRTGFSAAQPASSASAGRFSKTLGTDPCHQHRVFPTSRKAVSIISIKSPKHPMSRHCVCACTLWRK